MISYAYFETIGTKHPPIQTIVGTVDFLAMEYMTSDELEVNWRVLQRLEVKWPNGQKSLPINLRVERLIRPGRGS